MPSGRTHDSITFLLAVPAGFLIWRFSGSVSLAIIGALAFVFGGLMFGPDLDTSSVQYGRWGLFKIIWVPYKMFFKHRSFWTHGLIFGTLLRILYFLGMITVLAVGVFIIAGFAGYGAPLKSFEFTSNWSDIGNYLRHVFGPYVLYTVFAGLWLGAASHSFSDWALSYIKTGKP